MCPWLLSQDVGQRPLAACPLPPLPCPWTLIRQGQGQRISFQRTKMSPWALNDPNLFLSSWARTPYDLSDVAKFSLDKIRIIRYVFGYPSSNFSRVFLATQSEVSENSMGKFSLVFLKNKYLIERNLRTSEYFYEEFPKSGNTILDTWVIDVAHVTFLDNSSYRHLKVVRSLQWRS